MFKAICVSTGKSARAILADGVVYEQCGEGINFRREVMRDGKILCRAYAGESYYKPF
jgi:formylmethanofuran dehydrogenase subunit E